MLLMEEKMSNFEVFEDPDEDEIFFGPIITEKEAQIKAAIENRSARKTTKIGKRKTCVGAKEKNGGLFDIDKRSQAFKKKPKQAKSDISKSIERFLNNGRVLYVEIPDILKCCQIRKNVGTSGTFDSISPSSNKQDSFNNLSIHESVRKPRKNSSGNSSNGCCNNEIKNFSSRIDALNSNYLPNINPSVKYPTKQESCRPSLDVCLSKKVEKCNWQNCLTEAGAGAVALDKNENVHLKFEPLFEEASVVDVSTKFNMANENDLNRNELVECNVKSEDVFFRSSPQADVESCADVKIKAEPKEEITTCVDEQDSRTEKRTAEARAFLQYLQSSVKDRDINVCLDNLDNFLEDPFGFSSLTKIH